MEFRGSSDSGDVPMATKVQVVVMVEETSQASDTIDVEAPFSGTTATHNDSTEKTALAVAAIAAVDLTNLFFLLHGDTGRWWRWGRWTGGISVLFAALMSAAALVLALHGTVVVSAARRRGLFVASAAALFVASAGTVVALLDAQGRSAMGTW